MFTGLVADLGTVESVDALPHGRRLVIHSVLARELAEGDSVAVDGVCLTATALGDDRFAADVMQESLQRTTLDALAAGAHVNLELALRATDRLGGHLVQGHVDGVGTVRELAEDGIARVVTIAADDAILKYVVEKGSIAVNGVSLTVVRVHDDGFDVSLIPETVKRTSFATATPGVRVNLEPDMIAKYLERVAAR